MKVALVHDWLTGLRGGEKCLEILCRRFPDATLHTLLHRRGSTSPDIEQMRIETSFLQKLPGSLKFYRYLLPLMPRAVERLQIPADTDAVISISHAVAKSIQPPPGAVHICYCLTPMRYAWQMRDHYFNTVDHHLDQPKFLHPVSALREELLDRLQRWDRDTSDRVTHYVASSQTILRRIETCYGRTAPVIYPPVNTDYFTPAPVAREDFYLCVSAMVPYKRVDLAIQACNRLRRRLVVIGDGPKRRALERLAGPTVSILGWRSDDEIRDHYRQCRALLFPSWEDFGIVPVEAQACGAPVIAFNQGGATETVLPTEPDHVGTGVFFDAQEPESLCQAIQWFEYNQQLLSPALARHQALRFDRQKFEDELIAYILQAAERPTMPANEDWPNRAMAA